MVRYAMSLLIIQPDATAGFDAGPQEAAPTTTTGSNTGVGLSGVGATGSRIYLHCRWDLSALNPATDTVSLVHMYYRPNAAVTADRTYQVYLLDPSNADYSESQMTWNEKKTGSAWTGGATGGGTAGTDHSSSNVGTGSVSNGAAVDTDMEFTLDNATVQAKLGTTLPLVIKRDGSTSSSTPTFRTSDTTTVRASDSTSNKPRLEITYTSSYTETSGEVTIASIESGTDTEAIVETSNNTVPIASIESGTDSLTAGDNPAVSGTASCRATDAVAFPQCTYTGDSEGNETITVERKIQGALDSTYVTIPTYYDRTNKIAWGGHSQDVGGGSKVWKGDIALTGGASYTYRFSFSGGSTSKTVNQTMLPKLDPLAHANRRVIPTIWGYNASDSVAASEIRKNSFIGMTNGDQSGHSADMADVRGSQTDMPFLQYISPEVDAEFVTSNAPDNVPPDNIDWHRNSWIIDSTALTSFLAAYSEDWFLHANTQDYAGRIYNSGYGKWVMNWSTSGFREWVYAQFLEILYSLHTSATSAATRFQMIFQDNLQGANHIDQNWRTKTDPTPITIFETNVDTATEYSNKQREFLGFLVDTGTYIAANLVNTTATGSDRSNAASVLNGLFLESTFTNFSSATAPPYASFMSATSWKAQVDSIVTAATLCDHVLCYVQYGTAASEDDLDFALWSYAMVTTGNGPGGKIAIRPCDNANYGLDYIGLYAGPNWDVDWGVPLAPYQIDTTAPGGSGDNRVYYRRFANGTVWFNPSSVASLTPTLTGAPTLLTRTGAFVPSGGVSKHDRHTPRGMLQGILRGVH